MFGDLGDPFFELGILGVLIDFCLFGWGKCSGIQGGFWEPFFVIVGNCSWMDS